eukprot:3083632-Rhodomonas_salina.2
MGESSSMQFNVIHHPEALMRKMLIATFAVLAIQLPADWIPGQRKRENRGTKRETVRLFSRRWFAQPEYVRVQKREEIWMKAIILYLSINQCKENQEDEDEAKFMHQRITWEGT